MRNSVFLIFVTAALGLSGCSAADRVKRSNDLKEIGISYHQYHERAKKGPEKAEDLITSEMSKDLADKLKSGEIVFIYGVGFKDIQAAGQSTSETVLAYEKVTPDKGGHVLYGDSTVKFLSAEEFKKATLAKKK